MRPPSLLPLCGPTFNYESRNQHDSKIQVYTYISLVNVADWVY